ncbi:MAG: ABC transporter ATP-binding protein [Myxococcales bacterium]|nr:ABC transporter ATP-binding protein [Myxococcales bacterium]MCB9644445.1 ABC transporter ATP-binding protein [Myxococcales bacterium]
MRSFLKEKVKQFFETFHYGPRTLALVWRQQPTLTLLFAFCTLVAGLLPGGVAYVGKWIVDAVVLAAQSKQDAARWQAIYYVGLEIGLVTLLLAAQRAISVIQSLLRAQIGHHINFLILEKAVQLELKHFEDADFYDKMTRARREASSRPLGLFQRVFGLLQNGISLLVYGWLLFQFSGWIVFVLVLAALPAFFAETYFSREAFRLFRWRVPETRQQSYLEMVIAREDYVKEVQLFQSGPLLLQRYVEIFRKLFAEDRSLTLRRGIWGFFLSLFSSIIFYGAYGWIAWNAAKGKISLGEMTMYLLVFKQGQSAITASLSSVGGMYEDNLYLFNLYEYLDAPVQPQSEGASEGPIPGDGVRFEDVEYRYPGSKQAALAGVSFHLKPGQKLALVGENGSGKTTLIKLLTRLYTPTGGRITLDGLDIQKWDLHALRKRVGVIFQDFVRYQFKVGENIGIGDVDAFADRELWQESAEKGMAHPFIQEMETGYDTQLGRWFQDGRELSLGQWQKIALARAFMRKKADILVLDEPTSAMDAAAEARIFDHFREVTEDQMAILISHRFSTVRMADQIVVLDKGKVLEQGTHEELMKQDQHYAQLFSIQAAGYQ